MAVIDRLITIEEWRVRFSKPPAISTVRRWIRQGRIAPTPAKFGKQYYLTEEATYAKPGHDYPH
jgi:predicted site-specific integrase-resolvase